jgi:hypothetical protein
VWWVRRGLLGWGMSLSLGRGLVLGRGVWWVRRGLLGWEMSLSLRRNPAPGGLLGVGATALMTTRTGTR